MRAGNLDRTIVIESYVSQGQDETGQEIDGWTTLATMRAQIVQASTDEYFAAGGITSDLNTIFRTRYVAGVTSQSRILFESRYYNIGEIKEIGRRRGLELRAAAGEAALIADDTDGPSLDFSDPDNSQYIALVF